MTKIESKRFQIKALEDVIRINLALIKQLENEIKADGRTKKRVETIGKRLARSQGLDHVSYDEKGRITSLVSKDH